MPIDEAQQMRPHMAHLDEPAVKAVPESVKQETASEELALLTVILLAEYQKDPASSDGAHDFLGWGLVEILYQGTKEIVQSQKDICFLRRKKRFIFR